MTSSMTGFGHSRHINKETEIYCEIKSVNHRFLDISIKPNDISNELDLFIRDAISEKVKRMSIISNHPYLKQFFKHCISQ